MLAWMAYATLAGVLVSVASVVLEQNSPWLSGSRRFLWLAAIAVTLWFGIASLLPSGPRNQSAPMVNSARNLSPLPPRQADTPLPAMSAVSRPSQAAPQRSLANLDEILAIAWLSASAMCLTLLIASAWRVTRMRRDWRESVMAGVPVLVSHDVGPAVIGLIHHGIVVPQWVESLDDDSQRTVLTHEREHVRAGDPLLLWAATILVALVPWNAALWYALRRLRHAIEMDCDARVLRVRPDTRAYCTLLLDVGERTLAGVAPMAALAEPSTLLERRISAMAAPASLPRRVVTGSALASLVLVAAAFVIPRPLVSPGAQLAAFATRINAPRGAGSMPSEGVRGLAADADSGLTPALDVALNSLYPKLRGRADTSEMMVVLTYDARRHLRGSSMQAMPSWRQFEAPDFSSVQIHTFGMHNAPGLHTTVVPVVEQWDIDAEPVPSAYGGRKGPAESRNVPASRQFARRVDSLARASVPQAFGASGNALIVTVLFDGNGQIVRWFSRERSSSQSGDAVIASYGPAELLASVLPAPQPAFASVGAHTFHDAPGAVFLFAELAPTPERKKAAPGIEAHAIVLLKPIMTMESGMFGTTERLAPAERNRTVLVYTTGDAAMSTGGDAPRLRQDTMRVRLPATVSLELSRPGDVHFVSEDGRPFDLASMLAGTAASELSSRGTHIMIMSGGHGIRGIR